MVCWHKTGRRNCQMLAYLLNFGHKDLKILALMISQDVVRHCVEKGIIKEIGSGIDATHTSANTIKTARH